MDESPQARNCQSGQDARTPRKVAYPTDALPAHTFTTNTIKHLAIKHPDREPAMADPVTRCRARSASYQLLSIAFAHPILEITGQLADGRFQSAFAGHMETAFGRIPPLPRLAIDPSDFESAYIALFERGGRGRPPVPLCSGEYMQLLDGRPRPEVLLEHTRFYRHFGLKVRGHGAVSYTHLTLPTKRIV